MVLLTSSDAHEPVDHFSLRLLEIEPVFCGFLLKYIHFNLSSTK